MERTKTSINAFGLPNIVIPAEVLFNDALTQTEKLLFGFLKNLTANADGYCWASNRYLGRLLNVRADTTSSAINNLSREGYLRLRYTIRSDGMQVRKIYINKEYTATYEYLLEETFQDLKKATTIRPPGRPQNPLGKNPHKGKIQNPLGKNPNRGREKSQTDKGISPNKLDTKLDIDIDNELDNSSCRSGGNGNIKLSQFNSFWEIYPRKGNKGPSKKAWEKICQKKASARPTWNEIKIAIRAQMKTPQWQDAQFIPLASTWLNNERWIDDPKEMKGHSPKSRAAAAGHSENCWAAIHTGRDSYVKSLNKKGENKNV